jgi:hypothetical protein
MKSLILFLFFTLSLFAIDVKIGDAINITNVKDQFEKTMSIDSSVKKIILSFTKENGEIVKSFLEQNPNYLKDNNIKYLADLSGAPSFVLSWFMMPKFKKYNYSMGIVTDENKLKNIPRQNEKITIITLNNLKITNIEFVSNLK